MNQDAEQWGSVAIVGCDSGSGHTRRCCADYLYLLQENRTKVRWMVKLLLV